MIKVQYLCNISVRIMTKHKTLINSDDDDDDDGGSDDMMMSTFTINRTVLCFSCWW